MTVDHTVQVRINGEHRRVPEGISISELVSELGLDPVRVAVERNLEVVPRAQHDQTILRDGARLEVVTLVGGG